MTSIQYLTFLPPSSLSNTQGNPGKEVNDENISERGIFFWKSAGMKERKTIREQEGEEEEGEEMTDTPECKIMC